SSQESPRIVMQPVRTGQGSIDKGELITGLFLADLMRRRRIVITLIRASTACAGSIHLLAFMTWLPGVRSRISPLTTFTPSHRIIENAIVGSPGISGKSYFIDSRDRIKMADM